MSVVVWDGKTVACDRRVNYGSVVASVPGFSKIQRRADGTILATVGDMTKAAYMIRWWAEGAIPSKWNWNDTDNATLIVLYHSRATAYYNSPERVPEPSAPWAWGSGREFAIGAMAAGATARAAVKIASKYVPTCGHGVTSMRCEP